MAIQELRKINTDQELRQILEARSKEAHTRATIIADAHARSKAEGMAEGKEESELTARKAMAKRTLSSGMTLDQVSELTGFTPEELKTL